MWYVQTVGYVLWYLATQPRGKRPRLEYHASLLIALAQALMGSATQSVSSARFALWNWMKKVPRRRNTPPNFSPFCWITVTVSNRESHQQTPGILQAYIWLTLATFLTFDICLPSADCRVASFYPFCSSVWGCSWQWRLPSTLSHSLTLTIMHWTDFCVIFFFCMLHFAHLFYYYFFYCKLFKTNSKSVTLDPCIYCIHLWCRSGALRLGHFNEPQKISLSLTAHCWQVWSPVSCSVFNSKVHLNVQCVRFMASNGECAGCSVLLSVFGSSIMGYCRNLAEDSFRL